MLSRREKAISLVARVVIAKAGIQKGQTSDIYLSAPNFERRDLEMIGRSGRWKGTYVRYFLAVTEQHGCATDLKGRETAAVGGIIQPRIVHGWALLQNLKQSIMCMSSHCTDTRLL